MRKVWLIGLNGLTRLARDRKALLILLFMPLVLIGILGTALGGMISGQNIDPFPVVVINADEEARPDVPPGVPVDQVPAFHFGRILAEEVLGSEKAAEVINLIAAEPEKLEKARQAVADGQVVALVYIPPTFTADVLAGRPAEVQVVSDPGKQTQADIVAGVVGSFTEALSSGLLVARTLGPEQVQAFLQGATAEGLAGLPGLEEVPAGAREVTATQYYAAAMAAMFMVMTALTQAREIIRERKDGTLERILVSPTPRWAVAAGQVLGSALVVLAVFVILMVGTRLIYGVYWGPWLPAILIGAAFAVACAGVGVAAAGVLGSPRAADAAVGLVGNLFAILSGSMAPLYVFPDAMKMMARLIPNYWALQGYLDIMAGAGLDAAWTPVAVLLAIGVVTGGLGAWRLASR